MSRATNVKLAKLKKLATRSRIRLRKHMLKKEFLQLSNNAFLYRGNNTLKAVYKSKLRNTKLEAIRLSILYPKATFRVFSKGIYYATYKGGVMTHKYSRPVTFK